MPGIKALENIFQQASATHGIKVIDTLQNLLKKDGMSCSITKDAVDFDALKDHFCKGSHKPKSADCLFLLDDKKEILFIEFKSVESILKQYKYVFEGLTTEEEIKRKKEGDKYWEYLEKESASNTQQNFLYFKLQGFDFDRKIIDSLTLLSEVLTEGLASHEEYQIALKQLWEKSLRKNKFYLLTDASPRVCVTLRLMNLSGMDKKYYCLADKPEIFTVGDMEGLL
jgi:hypothetical protein